MNLSTQIADTNESCIYLELQTDFNQIYNCSNGYDSSVAYSNLNQSNIKNIQTNNMCNNNDMNSNRAESKNLSKHLEKMVIDLHKSFDPFKIEDDNLKCLLLNLLKYLL